MPNNRQAARRVVKSETANMRNRQDRSRMRTNIKSLLTAIAAKEGEKAKGLFTQVQKLLDTLAKKNVIPKNRASRYKQRLNARLKTIS
tara:strand:+ start:379 stop:642 length:264 start_codon:yes stop_codon:yes gene_type:complete